MLTKVGSAIMTGAILLFGGLWLFSVYLIGKVREYPLSPDSLRGEIFSASAGKGLPVHYVPAHLHNIIVVNSYGFVGAFLLFAIGYYFKNKR